MDKENRKKIKELFLRVFQNIDEASFDFNKERSQFENWDSLAHMMLISEIESAFGVSFEMSEVAGINKPEDILDLIKNKKNAKH